MDATEATIRTSLKGNENQMVTTFKDLKSMKMPKRTDKSKMIQFANAQATMVAAQGKITEDLHLLRTLGFMSTDKVVAFNKQLTQKIQKIEKSSSTNK